MYILADGGRIAASAPSEFVRVLREGSWFDSGCTDGEYMVNFSGRYRELHGVTVRTDTPEHFMDDLKKYGYIKAEKPALLLLRSPPAFSVGGDFSFSMVPGVLRILFSRGGLAPLPPFGKAFFLFHRPFRHDKNRLSMTIPASVPVVLASHGFFPYIRTDI